MLSIVTREDLTQKIVLENNEVSELRIIKLPDGWWHTTISHDLEKQKKNLKLIKFAHSTQNRRNAPSFPKIDYWDIRKGDYKVNEIYPESVKRNPEYKRLMDFARFSFAVVITVSSLALILSLIARV